jgi:hypothetical protein
VEEIGLPLEAHTMTVPPYFDYPTNWLLLPSAKGDGKSNAAFHPKIETVGFQSGIFNRFTRFSLREPGLFMSVPVLPLFGLSPLSRCCLADLHKLLSQRRKRSNMDWGSTAGRGIG